MPVVPGGSRRAGRGEHLAAFPHGERVESVRVMVGGVVTGARVEGMVGPGFEAVADSFARGLEKGELGAAVPAYVDGRKIVDLWGGWADAQRTREWQRDTIACTYSATKGMTATCAHHLVDRGLLDVDEPVAN